MSAQKSKGRTFETSIDLAAPPEHVWKAITQAEELVRWFPIDARSTPGPGGSIFYSWGPGLESECKIQIWEPPHHLRVDWIEHTPNAAPLEKSTGEPVRLAVDYFLTGKGGMTTLRLVHSGFGADRAWDGVYDDISHGWPIELRSLRTYLERHYGVERRVAWARAPIGGEQSEAWRRLVGPRGVSLTGNPRPGDRFEASLAGATLLEGVVVTNNPPREFSAVVSNMNDSLLRIAVESCFGRPEAWIWLSMWGSSESAQREIEQRMHELLASLFPASAPVRI